MKAFQLGWIFSVLIIVTTVIGCGGSKDPGKDYPNVTSKTTEKYDPSLKEPVATPPVVVTPPADKLQTFCAEPFKVTIKDDKGNLLLTFTEDTEATYEFKVRSLLPGDKFTVDTVNLSAGLNADLHAKRATFTQLQNDGGVAVFNFTWKPGKISNGLTDIQSLALKYNSPAATQCGKDLLQQLNLVVTPKKAPTTAAKVAPTVPPAPAATTPPKAKVDPKKKVTVNDNMLSLEGDGL